MFSALLVEIVFSTEEDEEPKKYFLALLKVREFDFVSSSFLIFSFATSRSVLEIKIYMKKIIIKFGRKTW